MSANSSKGLVDILIDDMMYAIKMIFDQCKIKNHAQASVVFSFVRLVRVCFWKILLLQRAENSFLNTVLAMGFNVLLESIKPGYKGHRLPLCMSMDINEQFLYNGFSIGASSPNLDPRRNTTVHHFPRFSAFLGQNPQKVLHLLISSRHYRTGLGLRVHFSPIAVLPRGYTHWNHRKPRVLHHKFTLFYSQ